MPTRTADIEGGRGLAQGTRRAVSAGHGALRVLAGAVAVALAALGPDLDATVFVVAVLAGAIHIPATALWAYRAVPSPRHPGVVMTAAADLALLIVVAAASGGSRSPVLLLVVLAPMIAALALDGTWMVALGVVGAAIVAVAFSWPDVESAVILVALAAYGVLVGVFSVRGQVVADRRLRGLDTACEALVDHRHHGSVHRLVSSEILVGALVPTADVRADLDADVETSVLARRVGEAAHHVRMLVQELHLLGGRAGDPRDVVRTVAARRVPRAHVTVDLDPTIPADTMASVVDIVRDALDAVTSVTTREVQVRACATGLGARVEIVATPGDAAAERDDTRAWGPLRGRAELLGATVSRDIGRRAARVVVRLHGLVDGGSGSPRLRARRFRETRHLIVAVRVGLAAAVAATTALAGGVEDIGVVLVAILSAWLVLFAWAFRRPRGPVLYAIGVTGDTVLLAATLAYAGDAQAALLPIALFVPVTTAIVLHPVAAVAAVAGTAAFVPLVADTPQPELTIAFLVAAGVAAVDSNLRRTVAGRLFARVAWRRRMLSGLVAAQDAERRRIAADLHDDALQLLLAARQDLEDGSPVALWAAADTLDRAVASLRDAAAGLDVRDEVRALDGGLARALAAVCTTRGAAPVEIDIDPRADGLEDGLVVRLVREFVTNAARHSGCTRVHIEVGLTAGFLTIDVDDDGCGFDRGAVRDAVSRGHIGLEAARERITRRGGGLDLLDSPGGGAHVHVRIPVDAPPRPPDPKTQSVEASER